MQQSICQTLNYRLNLVSHYMQEQLNGNVATSASLYYCKENITFSLVGNDIKNVFQEDLDVNKQDFWFSSWYNGENETDVN
jgi:hypothetical protein